MSLGEILLVLGVASIALGPKQLHVLARYVGKGMKIFHLSRRHLTREWDNLIQVQQLEENLKKASEGDKLYSTQRTNGEDPESFREIFKHYEILLADPSPSELPCGQTGIVIARTATATTSVASGKQAQDEATQGLRSEKRLLSTQGQKSLPT